jgi:hypothetical protein
MTIVGTVTRAARSRGTVPSPITLPSYAIVGAISSRAGQTGELRIWATAPSGMPTQLKNSSTASPRLPASSSCAIRRVSSSCCDASPPSAVYGGSKSASLGIGTPPAAASSASPAPDEIP